jgi:hypothetical protein
MDRARGFFELALTGAPTDDTLALLETTARDGDRVTGGEKLRRTLATAMAQGGQGARDGGRTRGALLRRAASMAHRDLNDVEQAFAWLGDALVAHVDVMTLDALEGLGDEVGDPRRSEAALTHALSEVFDGPLVRQLLARRAKVRREHMDDKAGAATDLKKLHDLSPTDQAVMEDLSSLLVELGDYRGMVQLYEDQILRGKDMNARADLARKVARMWEEQLTDAREAADAWRRVLRMRAGDAEATAGLERAKQNMLKRPDPEASDAYAPPKMAASVSNAPAALKTDDALGEEKPSSTLETASPTGEVAEPGQVPSVRPPAATEANLDDAPTASLASGAKPVPPAAPSDPRPERPRDVWFRSSQDEATMSALSGADTAAELPLDSPPHHTPSDGVYTSAPKDPTSSQGRVAACDAQDSSLGGGDTGEVGSEDLGSTNEVAAFDDSMLESTAARPQLKDEVFAGVPHPPESTEDVSDEELLQADDLDDLISMDDPHETTEAGTERDLTVEAEKPKASRTLPPPLPRT